MISSSFSFSAQATARLDCERGILGEADSSGAARNMCDLKASKRVRVSFVIHLVGVCAERFFHPFLEERFFFEIA